MFRRHLAAVVLVLIAFGAAPSTAKATLIGDTVHLEAVRTGAFVIGSLDAVVVDPGVEFLVFNRILWAIDVAASSFRLGFNLGGFLGLAGPVEWALEGLDWVGQPGQIVGVTHTGGTGSNPLSISFDARNIYVVTPPETRPPQVFTYEFSIQVRHVPEPGSLALIGLGLAGLGLSLRRARQK